MGLYQHMFAKINPFRSSDLWSLSQINLNIFVNCDLEWFDEYHQDSTWNLKIIKPVAIGINYVLSYTLISHHFLMGRKSWMNLIWAFLWITWKERKNHLFQEKENSYECYFELIIFHAMNWCKGKTYLRSYSLESHLSFDQW